MRWLIIGLLVMPSSAVWAKPGGATLRSPFFVEVNENSIVLRNDNDLYGELFPDKKQYEITVENIPKTDEFNKLLEYVLNHKATSGTLRRRRDTIIHFLVRPEGVETYREAKRVVDRFEKGHEKSLVVNVLANGASVVQSLSGKSPLLDDKIEAYRSDPKDLPRRPDSTPLLQPITILVRNGRVIPFIHTDKQMLTDLEERLKAVIDDEKIDVNEHGYISDLEQASKLIDEVNKDMKGNKHFEVKLVSSGSQIRLQLTPTDACGEEPSKAVRGFFAKALRKQQTRHYLRYLVEPDSFETYAAIRQVTDTHGFYAGWSIIDPDSYTYSLASSRYHLGVRPPPRAPQGQPGSPSSVKGVLD